MPDLNQLCDGVCVGGGYGCFLLGLFFQVLVDTVPQLGAKVRLSRHVHPNQRLNPLLPAKHQKRVRNFFRWLYITL